MLLTATCGAPATDTDIIQYSSNRTIVARPGSQNSNVVEVGSLFRVVSTAYRDLLRNGVNHYRGVTAPDRDGFERLKGEALRPGQLPGAF